MHCASRGEDSSIASAGAWACNRSFEQVVETCSKDVPGISKEVGGPKGRLHARLLATAIVSLAYQVQWAHKPCVRWPAGGSRQCCRIPNRRMQASIYHGHLEAGLNHHN